MSKLEVYKDPLDVSFEMPTVRLVSMEPNKEKMKAIKSPVWRRIVSWSLATRNRKFVLDRCFKVKVDRFPDARLNGELIVPAQLNGKTIQFDGASIPLPWFVAALSGNALRPLGSVLIPSIVHDYLFDSGSIDVGGEPQEVDRETADQLFLEMFRTVSGMRVLPWITWGAVRAGAILTHYKGDRGGVTPGLLLVVVAALLLFYLLSLWSKTALVTVLFLLFGVWFLDLIMGVIAAPYQADQAS